MAAIPDLVRDLVRYASDSSRRDPGTLHRVQGRRSSEGDVGGRFSWLLTRFESASGSGVMGAMLRQRKYICAGDKKGAQPSRRGGDSARKLAVSQGSPQAIPTSSPPTPARRSWPLPVPALLRAGHIPQGKNPPPKSGEDAGSCALYHDLAPIQRLDLRDGCLSWNVPETSPCPRYEGDSDDEGPEYDEEHERWGWGG